MHYLIRTVSTVDFPPYRNVEGLTDSLYETLEDAQYAVMSWGWLCLKEIAMRDEKYGECARWNVPGEKMHVSIYALDVLDTRAAKAVS